MHKGQGCTLPLGVGQTNLIGLIILDIFELTSKPHRATSPFAMCGIPANAEDPEDEERRGALYHLDSRAKNNAQSSTNMRLFRMSSSSADVLCFAFPPLWICLSLYVEAHSLVVHTHIRHFCPRIIGTIRGRRERTGDEDEGMREPAGNFIIAGGIGRKYGVAEDGKTTGIAGDMDRRTTNWVGTGESRDLDNPWSPRGREHAFLGNGSPTLQLIGQTMTEEALLALK